MNVCMYMYISSLLIADNLYVCTGVKLTLFFYLITLTLHQKYF